MNRSALTAIVERAVSELTAEQMVALLDRAGIANGRLNSIEEVAAHPQLGARGRWRTVETGAGPMEALLPPANVRGVEPAMGPVPRLGQHTDAVLSWLGYDEVDIAALHEEGVV